MMKIVLSLAVAFFIMLVIDGVWLVLIAKDFYRSNLGHLLAAEPNWLAAGVFYVVFIIGLTIFVVLPGIGTEELWSVAMRGALFGLVTYATYDLTNQATLRDWPVLVTIVDLCWGSFLTGTVSTLTVLVVKRFTT